jgi:hypothetical protein
MAKRIKYTLLRQNTTGRGQIIKHVMCNFSARGGRRGGRARAISRGPNTLCHQTLRMAGAGEQTHISSTSHQDHHINHLLPRSSYELISILSSRAVVKMPSITFKRHDKIL